MRRVVRKEEPKMSIGRFTIALVVGLAALAVAAPLAGAGNTHVDDYWRDQALAANPSDTIVDDYFRDQPAPVSIPANTIVDDYFRDPPAAVSSGTGFDWADFGIGVAAAVGGMLVLTGLGLGLIAARQSRGGRTHSTEAV
jgi:F0F1-type ATP synthase membrane subunit c/vacuolar-type H+-ATPase subunit K